VDVGSGNLQLDIRDEDNRFALAVTPSPAAAPSTRNPTASTMGGAARGPLATDYRCPTVKKKEVPS